MEKATWLTLFLTNVSELMSEPQLRAFDR